MPRFLPEAHADGLGFSPHGTAPPNRASTSERGPPLSSPPGTAVVRVPGAPGTDRPAHVGRGPARRRFKGRRSPRATLSCRSVTGRSPGSRVGRSPIAKRRSRSEAEGTPLTPDAGPHTQEKGGPGGAPTTPLLPSPHPRTPVHINGGRPPPRRTPRHRLSRPPRTRPTHPTTPNPPNPVAVRPGAYPRAGVRARDGRESAASPPPPHRLREGPDPPVLPVPPPHQPQRRVPHPLHRHIHHIPPRVVLRRRPAQQHHPPVRRHL